MTARSVRDQLGSNIVLLNPPKRIISLVPSQTELLYDLGLDTEVVGITKFCVHPNHWQKSKQIVGGTKKFRFDVIDALSPDLIIGNKEENYLEGIEYLQKTYPVWMSDIVSLQNALDMIEVVGELTGTEDKATKIIENIQRAFASIKGKAVRRVLYLIWREPWMGAGDHTFIDTMLNEMGLVNSLKDRLRYPELSENDIINLDPDLVLLSSEPYPFKENNCVELQRILPLANIILVDGEMFSWYGSRLIHAPAYLNSLKV
jgi:ABC-type Fe3+-hydroxamate transport system substrate-binding protein